MAATALSVAPVDFLIRPGTAYAQICECAPGTNCDCSQLCCDGFTQFCCTVNNGVNACPAGTFAGGWWKADGSIYCAGPRYYIDCMGECHGCGCGGGSFCPSCDGLTCQCALGDCNNRHVGCAEFRYGQCHQEIACSGRISCRVVSCTPPWLLDPTCSTVAQTDDSTANHFAACQNGPTSSRPPPPQEKGVATPVAINFRGQEHVFAVDPNGGLRHYWYDPGNPKSGWGRETLGSGLIPSGVPAASTDLPNQLHVFADRTDGRLLHIWSQAGISGWPSEVL
jgi:hypothetical protein